MLYLTANHVLSLVYQKGIASTKKKKKHEIRQKVEADINKFHVMLKGSIIKAKLFQSFASTATFFHNHLLFVLSTYEV